MTGVPNLENFCIARFLTKTILLIYFFFSHQTTHQFLFLLSFLQRTFYILLLLSRLRVPHVFLTFYYFLEN